MPAGGEASTDPSDRQTPGRGLRAPAGDGRSETAARPGTSRRYRWQSDRSATAVSLAGDFPERAAGKSVGHRRPVAQAVRPRDAVIHRALIRMQELIDLERVVVDHPGAAQVAADRRRRHLEFGGIAQQPPGKIDRCVHRDDLDGWKNVAFVTCIVLRQDASGPRRTYDVRPARERRIVDQALTETTTQASASSVPFLAGARVCSAAGLPASRHACDLIRCSG